MLKQNNMKFELVQTFLDFIGDIGLNKNKITFITGQNKSNIKRVFKDNFNIDLLKVSIRPFKRKKLKKATAFLKSKDDYNIFLNTFKEIKE